MAYKPNEIKRLEKALNINDYSYTYTTNDKKSVISLELYESEYESWTDINENFEIISTLKDLQRLEISVKGFDALAHLSTLLELEYIRVEYGAIKSLEPLRNLKKLNYLDLEGSQVSDLEPIAYLESLKYINLSLNKISDITPLHTLIKLEELHLGYNKIHCIESLYNLKKLQQLTVNNNQLTNVDSIQQLAFLETINISNNNIKDISFFGNFKNLKHLSITNSGINDISFIHNLKKLVSLNIGQNNITSIVGLEKLTHLVYLDISKNYISDITELSTLTSIERLKIDYNPIHDISSIKDLLKLNVLDASNIKAVNFNVISNFKGLTYLRLTENSINNIEFLSSLNKLLHLFLDHNQITDINPISNNSLITLSLESNQVKEIFLLAKMFYLSSLNLINNPVGGSHFKYPFANKELGELHLYELYLNLGEQYLSDGNYDYARACLLYLLTDKFKHTNQYDTNNLSKKVELLTNDLNNRDPEYNDAYFTNNKGVRYFYKAESFKTTGFNLSLKLLETLMQMKHPLQYVLYSNLNKYINFHFVLNEQQFRLSLLKATKANLHTDIESLIKKHEYKNHIQDTRPRRSTTSLPSEPIAVVSILLILVPTTLFIGAMIYIIYGIINGRY